MTQQDIHPHPTRTRPDQGATEQATEHIAEPTAQTAEQTPEQTPEQTRPHHWLGQSEYRSPSSTPTTGIPTQTTAQPDWYGTPATGGHGGYPTYPPTTPTPTPAPKAKPGRGLGQVTAVAILAAALASGGTYAATRYATPAPSSSPAATTQSNGSTSPQVIQGNAAAPDWTATAKAVGPSVVSITVQSNQGEGQGSGVIFDGQGHILTNNHVATGAGSNATISVTLSDGRTYDAKIVGTDASTDLAVLQLTNPPSDLVPITIGDSSQLTVGQPVMAIGNPLGLSGTVTTGIVSALDRPVTTQASEGGQGQQGQQGQLPGLQQQGTSDTVVTNAIQTSAAINPGNSGGALVTADGKLIGINSSIASLGSSSGGQSGNIGIGFAIPSNEAKSIADQLIATGTAQHAYIGVSASDTTVTDGSSKRQAALIQSVSSGTPAAQAGLQAQDAVIAIDGEAIDSSEALVANVHEHKVGDTVTVTVLRGSQKQDIKVTLAARPG
ncbi:MAG TPA: trypsin-like peptidase domain-containing protein [Lapillicoccus sp.]|nr:trypsin-like peptidase domain-containing protein [Lapillicoccus sp.]